MLFKECQVVISMKPKEILGSSSQQQEKEILDAVKNLYMQLMIYQNKVSRLKLVIRFQSLYRCLKSVLRWLI